MLAGDLNRAALPAIIAPNNVVVRFPLGYNRQYATYSEPGRLQKIQEALNRVTGEKWTVRLELAQDLPPTTSEPSPTPEPKAKEAAAVNPLIEAIKKSLEARVMRIDDGFGQIVETKSSDDETQWAATQEE